MLQHIVAASAPTHTPFKSVCFEKLTPIVTRILAALIGVNQNGF